MDCPSPASTCTITGDVEEMEATPSDGSNDEGTIDHVLDILDKYSHPFILVGYVALRWMGCSSSVDDGFDLVLRAYQLPTIVSSLVETGYWTIFDSPKALEIFKSDAAWQDVENMAERTVLEYLCEVGVVLKWEGIDGIGFSYMRLWTNETYHIDVDTSPLVEVPQLYPWNPFLVEKEFHPALRRDDGWLYGPNIFDEATANDGANAVFSKLYQRTKGTGNTTPINILSIPAYLDALVYHKTHYADSKRELALAADVQMNNLTHDLFFELPHQMNPLLFQVETETENYLQSYFAEWKRSSGYVWLLLDGRVPLDVWDPDSYPENLISPFVGAGSMFRDARQASGSSSAGATPE